MTTYLAALMLVAAVALFVAAPLTGVLTRERRLAEPADRRLKLEHERGLALQGLRELEFDHAMGKLDEADYHALKASLEQRALTAMAGLADRPRRATAEPDTGLIHSAEPMPSDSPVAAAAGEDDRVASIPDARGSVVPTVNFCAQCGAQVATAYSFCGSCGINLTATPAAPA